MDLLSVIRRWRHRQNMPIREIARRTGLSRNTVRKYLALDETDPRYPKRIGVSKLDPYAETLASWLKRESKVSRKQRRNLKQLYHDLMVLGYEGSYDRVAAFAREWRRKAREAAQQAAKGTYVPLVFAPGEAFQFDWSEDFVRINKKSTKVIVAHMKLCHSRVFVVRAYPAQSHEMLFDAHNHCLRILGGVPERGIYDNMKTAVDKVGRGKHRQVNVRFRAMASHFLFEPDFCNPAAGWEKGQVEKNVLDTRHRIWQNAPAFKTLGDLNQWLERRCQQLWTEIRHPEQKERTIDAVWREEKKALMAMPPAFDGYVELTKRVSPTCLIVLDRNRYSVPAAYANRTVSLRVYAFKLVIVAEAQVVAEHKRVFTRDHSAQGKTIYDWRHYLAVVQRKPGALRNGAPFARLPRSFAALQAVLRKQQGGDREMADILALVLHHDEHLVELAVAQALKSGIVTKVHVLNLLSRLLDQPMVADLDIPEHLHLQAEPEANTHRYDHLREVNHAS